MGIPACIDITSPTQIGLFTYTGLYACDKWAVLHIITPMYFGLFTKSAWFAFVIAGIGELLEYIVYALFGNFVVFINNGVTVSNREVENFVGIFIEDWLFQGGIAAILTLLFIHLVNFPALITTNDFWYHPPRFWYYTFGVLLLVVPAFQYPAMAGNFRLGIFLYPFIQGAIIVLLIIFQPENTWKSYGRRDQILFWLLPWIFGLVLNIQNMFDYFFSGHVQSWLWSGIFLIAGIFWGTYKSYPPGWWNRIEYDYRFTSTWK